MDNAHGYLLILILILLLSQFASALWLEEIDVRVVDSRMRALQNATVSITYQSDACDRHNVLTFTTNETGWIHARFFNTVEEFAVVDSCVERSYLIDAVYLGATTQKTGIVNESKNYTLVLPVVRAGLKVQGYGKTPLYPTTARIKDLEFYGNENGIISIEIPTGKTFDVEVSYGNIKKIVALRADADGIEQKVELPVYNLRIKLYDEWERRLEGNITIDNITKESTPTKDALFKDFPYPKATFTVSVGNLTKEIETEITSDFLNLYFDFSPPEIRYVTTRVVEKENLYISATFTDGGKRPSGLAEQPIIEYSFVDTDVWIQKSMYQLSPNVFDLTIPTHGTDVDYKLSAVDKQGNKREVTGSYSFKKEKPPEKPEEPEVPEEVPEKPLEEVPEEEVAATQFSIPHIIAMIVAIFIVFLVYRKIKEAI